MTQTPLPPHTPVMLEEVLAALSPTDGEVYIDGTFGAGGYSRAILGKAACTVIGIDRDPTAQSHARLQNDHFIFVRGCFGDADRLARSAGYEAVDGFVLDLGVSSMQLDEADRGFSFRFDGSLDMRMDTASGGMTAADIVNEANEAELADMIYEFGEERHSRRIARAIVAARREKRIERTGELADIVRRVVPRSKKDQIDPATRTFQALRLAVNRELDELRHGLEAAERLLKCGGRLIVVSFHSLEDAIVKAFLSERSGRIKGISRHLPGIESTAPPPTFTLPSSRPLSPTEGECAANPRARSAKMRVAIRTGEKAWGTA